MRHLNLLLRPLTHECALFKCLFSIDSKWNSLSQYLQGIGLFVLWYSMCLTSIFFELNLRRHRSHWKYIAPWIFLCFEKFDESLKHLLQKVHLYIVSFACSRKCALYLSTRLKEALQISHWRWRMPDLFTGFLPNVARTTCSIR